MNKTHDFLICSLLFTGMAMLAMPLLIAGRADASALQIRPLMYQERLKAGEVKKGHIEVANPTGSPIVVSLSVKGFKQIDNEGNLEFFDDEQLSQGILLDLHEVELGPLEAVRVYFLADSKKLPEGGVFAAILASSQSGDGSGITPAAQLGTLLAIENGNGGPRNAVVASFNMPFFHFGDSVSGTVAVRNTSDPNKPTGFFPKINTVVGPVFPQRQSHEGPLIFAGITRNVSFALPTDRFGFHRVEVEVTGSTRSQWVFLITGYWRWVAPLFAIGGVAIVLIVRKHKKQPLRFTKKRR